MQSGLERILQCDKDLHDRVGMLHPQSMDVECMDAGMNHTCMYTHTVVDIQYTDWYVYGIDVG